MYTVMAIRFAPGVTESEREKAMNALAISPIVIRPGKVKPGPKNKVTWLGREAREHTYTPEDSCVLRRTHNDTTGYIVVAQATSGTLDPEKLRTFLDGFRIEKE